MDWSRLGLLVALVVLGVSVGATATAFGVEGPFGSDEEVAASVSDEGIVVGDEEVTLQNTTWLRSLEISGSDGHYTVETVRERPFSEEQRQTAINLVRTSDRVELADRFEYEIIVEPIRKYEADQAFEANVGNVSEDSGTFKIDDVTVEDGSVTIDREYSIVEDQLNVRVLGPDGGTRYSVIVDLTVDEIIDVRVLSEPGGEAQSEIGQP
jgi:hypothetical protein